MRPAHVYIFWNDTTPLYVGCTVDLKRRMKEHRIYSCFAATHVSVIPFEDHREALEAEAHYIDKLRPRNNVRGNPARRYLVDRLASLEWDRAWFATQPKYVRDLTHTLLGPDARAAA